MDFRNIDRGDLETRVVIQAAILLIAIVGLIGLSLAWGGDPGSTSTMNIVVGIS